MLALARLLIRSLELVLALPFRILRALVFSDKTWEMLYEINTGKISSYLIRPISYIGFSLCRDAADKVTQLISAVLEVAFAVWLPPQRSSVLPVQ